MAASRFLPAFEPSGFSFSKTIASARALDRWEFLTVISLTVTAESEKTTRPAAASIVTFLLVMINLLSRRGSDDVKFPPLIARLILRSTARREETSILVLWVPVTRPGSLW